ncbi:MAG: magnesium transporter [Firmicutes bacterium]|nr:magnesium transporter [Bacillota bacterium]MDD6830259.1 magnesium transporter [Bacillota bacterium]
MDNIENMDFEAIHEKQSDELMELLDSRRMKELQTRLEDMNEFDVAEFLSEIGDNRMPMVFRLLSKETAADVFANFDAPEQEQIINSITDSELSAIIEELYVDDAVDMMEELPANVVKRVMRTATPETRRLINQYLNYPENSAGSIMTAEFIDLKKYMNVREAIARIRRIGEDKETIYICFVTSADRKLEGVVSVKDLLLNDDETVIEDIMDTNVIFCMTHDDQEEVSEKISDYDLMAIPVVDKEGRLVGIVTVDDIIDVLEQETTEDFEIMAAMTPSDKPYSRTGAIDMWKNRVPWLLFLMLSATFTTMILNSFEDALAVQAVLIGFIPIIMGTGGNSGAQSSTAIIRSLSLGDTEPKDALKVIWKEWRVALLCGLTLAAVNFAKMLLVDNLLLGNPDVDYTIALIVSLAIVFTVMFAKVVGSFLPMLAEKIGLDPAVVATPLITTISDAVSLLIYLEIAKVFLHI